MSGDIARMECIPCGGRDMAMVVVTLRVTVMLMRVLVAVRCSMFMRLVAARVRVRKASRTDICHQNQQDQNKPAGDVQAKGGHYASRNHLSTVLMVAYEGSGDQSREDLSDGNSLKQSSVGVRRSLSGGRSIVSTRGSESKRRLRLWKDCFAMRLAGSEYMVHN